MTPKKEASDTVSYPLRIPRSLDLQLIEAARRSGMSKQDIVRHAIAAGLKWLQQNDYDLTRPLDESILLRSIITELQSLLDTATARVVQFSAAAESPALPMAAEAQTPYQA